MPVTFQVSFWIVPLAVANATKRPAWMVSNDPGTPIIPTATRKNS
jgi:hypothetical protein